MARLGGMADEKATQALPRIGAPATRALAEIGVTTLAQVSGHTASALLALHGVGPKAVRILEQELARRGLAFRDEQAG